MNKIKFIDFFAGIGGFHKGLADNGFQCVGWVEIDKYARKSYQAIYDVQDIWNGTDIKLVKGNDLPQADIWCFGSPCVDVSLAGQRKGLIHNGEQTRSGLFFEIMRLLDEVKENKPEWLLMENVKGLFSSNRGFDFLRVLVEMGERGYDAQWELFNSAEYGVPQHRERVYILAHQKDRGTKFIFPIKPPQQTQKVLKDILETNVDTKYFLSDEQTRRIVMNDKKSGRIAKAIDEGKVGILGSIGFQSNTVDKSFKRGMLPDVSKTLCAGRNDVCVVERKINTSINDIQNNKILTINPKDGQNSRVYGENGLSPALSSGTEKSGQITPRVMLVGNKNPSGSGQSGNIYSTNGLAPTICDGTKCYTNVMDNILVKPCIAPDRVNKRQNGRRIKDNDEPMFTLTAQDKHGVVFEINKPQVVGGVGQEKYGKQFRQGNRIYSADNVSPALQSNNGNASNGSVIIESGIVIRRLTAKECWRLQGHPDSSYDKAYAAGVSISQLYKQAGNGVTVDVVRVIGKAIKNAMEK